MPSREIQAGAGKGCYSMPPLTDHHLTSDSESLTPELRAALRHVERSIEEMNDALRNAAQAGATIELRRRARVHSGDGAWADQMAPLVVAKSR